MSNERSQNGVFILLGVFLLMLGLLIYLRVHPPQTDADFPPPSADPAQVSDKTTVNFYLDGSGSIKHLLLAPDTVDGRPTTNYMKDFLDKCGAQLSNALGARNVNFYSFGGGQVSPIPAGDGPGKGRSPAAADAEQSSGIGADPHNMALHPESFKAQSTSIEVPINHSRQKNGEDQGPEVKVIVTDLYESENKMERPANALAEKYLTDDKSAVDILAVRNPSDGQVEDMPGSAKNEVLQHAANTMPFYIIVAGPTADVRKVMGVLVSGTELSKAKEQHLTQEFFFSRTPQRRSVEPMTPNSTDGKFVVLDSDYQHRKIPLVRLSKGTVEVSWPAPAKPSDDAVKLYDAQSLRPVVLSAPPPPAANSPAPSAEWQENADAEAAVGECAPVSTMCKSIDWSKLPKHPANYLVRFDRIATAPPRVLEPGSDEIKKWNIEGSSVSESVQKSKGTWAFPDDETAGGARAGKTPDLSKFLKALQTRTYHAPLVVTSYYVYLQAD